MSGLWFQLMYDNEDFDPGDDDLLGLLKLEKRLGKKLQKDFTDDEDNEDEEQYFGKGDGYDEETDTMSRSLLDTELDEELDEIDKAYRDEVKDDGDEA